MMSEKNKHAVAFGEVLRERRKSLGMTQDALAEKADLERTFISFLERGERQPTLTTMVSLADALQVRPEELVRLAVARVGK